jgi:hypothetical protein
MKYLLFIYSDGVPVPDALAVMQRELPAWIEEMDGRGARLFGRELELPEAAATVRVRDGETLVSDGPFAETKEFVAGFDVLDCANLDEAIEVAATSPVSRYHPMEIRPFRGEPQLSEGASAFARDDDSAGTPYLLAIWTTQAPAAALDTQTVKHESEAWRQQVQSRGIHVFGGALGNPETATTLRKRDGETVLSDGPGVDADEFIAAIEVVSCADRQEAIDLAAAHPSARYHAIEVRPFYSE